MTQVFVCGSRRGALVASCNPLLLLSPQMLTYFSAFEVFFEENLPKLFAHFKTNNLTPDIYLIDWWVSPSRVPQLDPFSALVFLTVSPQLSVWDRRCCQVVHRVHFVLYPLSQFRCLVVFLQKATPCQWSTYCGKWSICVSHMHHSCQNWLMQEGLLSKAKSLFHF